MAFDRLETVVKSGRNGMPASVSLRSNKGARPGCYIGLSVAFAGELSIKSADRFDLLLGTGDMKGLIRLKRCASGLIAPKMLKGGAIFSCGFIERFGTEPEPKQFCHAKLVDADTIEIKLPAWGLEQDV